MMGRHQGGGGVVEDGNGQGWVEGEWDQKGSRAEKTVWRHDEKPKRPILF